MHILPGRLISATSLGILLTLSAVVGTRQAEARHAHAGTQAITILGFKFQPATVTIPVGTTVTWTNQDTVPHTATSDTGAFDTPQLSKGQSASVTFTQAGTFPYHCAVHSTMKASIVVQSVPLSANPAKSTALQIGQAHAQSQPVWSGYYDGHLDTYIDTDDSQKAQARSMHINFAPILARAGESSSPMYFVRGRTATGQLAVFGSEPGEKDYSPLWREFFVTWRAGAKAVLLIKDDQILNLQRKGKLTVRRTNIILNAPILSVGHS